MSKCGSKGQIRAVLNSKSPFKCNPHSPAKFMLRSDDLLYTTQYESVVDFLDAAYEKVEAKERAAFRRALPELFAEYLQQKNKPRVTREGPAISLLYLAASIRSYRQLPNFIAAFNVAELTEKEIDEVLCVVMAILHTANCRAIKRRVLSLLLNGSKFRTGHAITALQIELDCSAQDTDKIICKYAPMIYAVCLEVDHRGSAEDRKELEAALKELHAWTRRGRIKRRVNDVFRKYGTRPGRWPVLVERIVHHRAA